MNVVKMFLPKLRHQELLTWICSSDGALPANYSSSQTGLDWTETRLRLNTLVIKPEQDQDRIGLMTGILGCFTQV